jgi:hypothetical protein
MEIEDRIWDIDDALLKDVALPSLLREFAYETDVKTAIYIGSKVGGTRKYFPPVPDSDHWLSLLIGEEKAKRICKACVAEMGLMLEIPIGPGRAFITKFVIESLLSQGFSVEDVGLIVRKHFRVIRRYRKNMIIDGRLPRNGIIDDCFNKATAKSETKP